MAGRRLGRSAHAGAGGLRRAGAGALRRRRARRAGLLRARRGACRGPVPARAGRRRRGLLRGIRGPACRAPARCGRHLRAASLREVGALLGDRDAGLFTHAVALANWHDTHTHCPLDGTPTDPRPRRPLDQVPRGRHRALPAHRSRRHHAGDRPRRPVPAGQERRLAGPPGVDPGRLRRAGGVGRAGRHPRSCRGNPDQGHERALRRQPAVADAAQPDARLPRRSPGGSGHRRGPRRDRRGALVQPGRAARRHQGARDSAAAVGVDRQAHHRGLVRRAAPVDLARDPGTAPPP